MSHPLRHTGGGGITLHVDGFLDRHRQAEQWKILATCTLSVSLPRITVRSLQILEDYAVERPIEPCQSSLVHPEQFNGRNLDHCDMASIIWRAVEKGVRVSDIAFLE